MWAPLLIALLVVLKWVGIYLLFQCFNCFVWWLIWRGIKASARAIAGVP